MGEVKYLIGKWQAFIQQIVYLVGRGYKEYCLVLYPTGKEHKYKNIDEKLISKYQCDLNKNQRYYRKQKGYANYIFLRYKGIAIILKTGGKIHSKINEDDVFLEVSKQPIPIEISENMTLEIRVAQERIVASNEKAKEDEKNRKGNKKKRKKRTIVKEHISVYLAQKIYDDVLFTCLELLDAKRFKQMCTTFNNLNGLPAWSGIIDQRWEILNTLKAAAKKKGLTKKVIDFSKYDIKTKRRIYKVFDEIQ